MITIKVPPYNWFDTVTSENFLSYSSKAGEGKSVLKKLLVKVILPPKAKNYP
jgi:hypothetical protein